LGQHFIVEDRTMIMATRANAINATLYPNLNFNFDVAPIALRQPLTHGARDDVRTAGGRIVTPILLEILR